MVSHKSLEEKFTIKNCVSVYFFDFMSKQYFNNIYQCYITSYTIYIKTKYKIKHQKWCDKAHFAYTWRETLVDWGII